MNTFKSILCLLASMLVIGLASLLFADGEIWICFVTAIIIGVPVGFMVIGTINTAESTDYAGFSLGTLRVSERHWTLSYAIAVEAIPVQTLKYNQPELVYTGATVGGVSMGGFHVEGGDYTAKTIGFHGYRLGYATGRLDEKNQKIYDPIEKIHLTTSALIDSAKANTVVKKYLKESDIILPNPTPRIGNDFKNPLSRKDAQAILDWLTNSKTQ